MAHISKLMYHQEMETRKGLTILQQTGAEKVTKKTAEVLQKLGIKVDPKSIIKKIPKTARNLASKGDALQG